MSPPAPETTALAATDGMPAKPQQPGLYVHVPFCSKICPYCDFAVLLGGTERRAGYLEAVAAEARWWSGRWPHAAAPFDTLYLGGGTPSTLAPDQLGGLLAALREALPIDPEAWLSLEANPEDVTVATLAAWRSLGIHTVSLGVQSFADDALRFLGRRHDGAAARRAVEWALAAGFPIVNVDLIYGLPGQDAAAWRRDLATATALGPQHLSCYQLTVHEGTPFGFRRARGRLHELSEDRQADLFGLTHETLASGGWPGYEVSNFAASPSWRSRHNQKYWRHVPYLGLGPSAHSYDGDARWWNERKLGPWLAAIGAGVAPEAGRERIGPPERALEHLLLGLRSDGVDLALLRRLGWNPDSAAPLLERCLADGLLRLADDRLLPTLSGWAVADGLAAELAATAGRPASPRSPRSPRLGAGADGGGTRII
jgi:oxygen-independent coproporphyrinogen III oxidase